MQRIGSNLRPYLAFALTVIATAPALAQEPLPLTRGQAVAIALEKNPFRKMTVAEERVANAEIGLAQASFFPRVEFSETATRGNDAVYAFGTRLRQARFTEGDFAIDRLNYPDAIGNFATRFGGEWNVFNSFQTTHEIRRVRNLHAAAQQTVSRADQEVIFRVLDAYYGVLVEFCPSRGWHIRGSRPAFREIQSGVSPAGPDSGAQQQRTRAHAAGNSTGDASDPGPGSL
jgi:outer membrane protein TolC